MRRTAGPAIAVLMLFGSMMSAPPARAEGSTLCVYDLVNTFSPGLSLSPSTGVWHSGATGTATCAGSVQGQHPTGSGPLSVRGTYGTGDGDTCLQIGGDGRYSFTLPTLEGSVTVEDTFTWAVSAGVGTWNGRISSGGLFLAAPVAGDCLASPITRIRVTGVVNVPA